MTIRVGLAGYGTGGRHFHAPYITASQNCELAGITTRSPTRAAQARADYPGISIFQSLGELIDSGVDAVTLSTPPQTRRDLVLEAIARKTHVIADKPFAPDALVGQKLADTAETAGVILNVYHNRRWDTDIVTVKNVIAQGLVGTVRRFDVRLDQDDLETFEAGPTGGLLRDLGSHVVDQALHLFGPALQVTASIDWIDSPDGPSDAGFVVNLEHRDAVHSHVSATKLNHLVSRELRLIGSEGSYVSDYSDVQAQAISQGHRPIDHPDTWGYEWPGRYGVLYTADQEMPVPSAQGDYTAFYDLFAQAVEAGGPQPVPAAEAVDTLRVLDAARLSALEHRTVDLRER